VNAVCVPLPGRLATYQVIVGDDFTLGFIRLDVSARQWIAWPTENAACLRRFSEKDDAVQWLQEPEPAPAEAGQLPCSTPGLRKVAA
jgi:hypothetical protein